MLQKEIIHNLNFTVSIMDMKLRVFENTYTRFDNYLDKIKEYDEEMKTYYDLRDTNQRVDCFSDQVVKRFYSVTPKRQEMINVIKEQGFDLRLR